MFADHPAILIPCHSLLFRISIQYCGSSVAYMYGRNGTKGVFILLCICLDGKYFSGYHQANVPCREQLHCTYLVHLLIDLCRQ